MERSNISVFHIKYSHWFLQDIISNVAVGIWLLLLFIWRFRFCRKYCGFKFIFFVYSNVNMSLLQTLQCYNTRTKYNFFINIEF